MRLGTLLMATFAAGCGAINGESEPIPDKVVGVTEICRTVVRGIEGGEIYTRVVDGRAAECRDDNANNVRWLVTVRTESGDIYEVEAPLSLPVRLGDTWPPP
jgi:hypothetical protein